VEPRAKKRAGARAKVAVITDGQTPPDIGDPRSSAAWTAHLAGADEREARRYEANRRRGAWGQQHAKPVVPTAEE
jgi:hypothetical protein